MFPLFSSLFFSLSFISAFRCNTHLHCNFKAFVPRFPSCDTAPRNQSKGHGDLRVRYHMQHGAFMFLHALYPDIGNTILAVMFVFDSQSLVSPAPPGFALCFYVVRSRTWLTYGGLFMRTTLYSSRSAVNELNRYSACSHRVSGVAAPNHTSRSSGCRKRSKCGTLWIRGTSDANSAIHRVLMIVMRRMEVAKLDASSRVLITTSATHIE